MWGAQTMTADVRSWLPEPRYLRLFADAQSLDIRNSGQLFFSGHGRDICRSFHVMLESGDRCCAKSIQLRKPATPTLLPPQAFGWRSGRDRKSRSA